MARKNRKKLPSIQTRSGVFCPRGQSKVKFGKIAGARNVVFFNTKMLVVSAKSNLGCAAGRGLTGSFSDHSRFHKMSVRFSAVILRGRRSIW